MSVVYHIYGRFIMRKPCVVIVVKVFVSYYWIVHRNKKALALSLERYSINRVGGSHSQQPECIENSVNLQVATIC
jgi:hypothetical protein